MIAKRLQGQFTTIYDIFCPVPASPSSRPLLDFAGGPLPRIRLTLPPQGSVWHRSLPRESFKIIFNLAGCFDLARLFLETLQKYPLKQARNLYF